MNKSRKFLKLIAVSFLGAAILFAGCAKETPNPAPEKPDNKNQLTPVTIMLDWTPNTNHTGIYVAKEKGLFANEGLDVKIVQPSSQGTVEQLVAANQVEFGVSAQEQVTYARVQDLPLVSIATILQHNTSGFASLSDKNIQSAKDFEGKTYGGWGLPSEDATIKALMEKENADFNKVKMMNIGESDQIASLSQGNIDFVWIFYGWAGVQAEIANKQLNMIWLKDVEPVLDYYTPVIVTGEKMIQEKPEIVRSFMKAVSEGYDFAVKNPNEAAEILIKNAPEADPNLIKKSQEWLSPKYKEDADRWGVQKPEVWENYAKWLSERKLIDRMIDSDKAFTNDFLPKS